MSVAAFLRDSRVGGLHKNGQVPKTDTMSDEGTSKKTIAIRFLDILSPGQVWRRAAATWRAMVSAN
jgi:hypothetical protein